jgi:hypothetical protein
MSKLVRWFVLAALVIMLPVIASTGFSWGTKTCTVLRGYQASLSVQQPGGNYIYTIVTNASVDGKWAVLSQTVEEGRQNDHFFKDPLKDLDGGKKVAFNVLLRTGYLSLQDNRIVVEYKAGSCLVTRLDYLYPDF